MKTVVVEKNRMLQVKLVVKQRRGGAVKSGLRAGTVDGKDWRRDLQVV
jgi:hypothetical protein